MSDSAQTVIQRVISGRLLMTRLLFPSSISAFVAALLLAVAALAIGVGVHVLNVTPFRPDTSLVERLIQQTVSSSRLLQSTETALAMVTGVLLLCVFVRVALHGLVERRVVAFVAQAANRLRHRIHRHALRMTPGDLTGSQREAAARIFESSTSQLESSAGRWGWLKSVASCDAVVVVICLVLIQWRVAIECVVPIVVCWYVARAERKRHTASASLLEEQLTRGIAELSEDLGMARLVAGYGMAEAQSERFTSSLKRYEDRSQALRLEKQRGRTIALVSQAAMIAIPAVLIARHLVFGSLIGLPAAAMLVFLLCALVVVLHRSGEQPERYGEALVVAQEINDYLLEVPPVSQVVGARFLEPMSRVLQFDQVCLHADQHQDVLNMLDLKVPAGQRLALLSLNDSETDALLSLIPRFTDPSRGQVLIDGQDIRKVTLDSLRAETVIVDGAEPVFGGSILDNIIAGRDDISRQDAIEASKLAHAENFIRKLPKGYDTDPSTVAGSLGPGHRFRLGLARAIARKPALLIVKEPQTQLDSETKALLDDTYQRICQDRTVIFVPSRLSTVKKCDRIVVLRDGKVAVDGKHDDLVRSSELYRHWEYVRFNVFRNDA